MGGIRLLVVFVGYARGREGVGDWRRPGEGAVSGARDELAWCHEITREGGGEGGGEQLMAGAREKGGRLREVNSRPLPSRLMEKLS